MARTTWGPLSTDEQNAIEFAPVGEPGVLVAGTAGGLLKRNADGTIGNSILSESGSVLTAAGRLVIAGGTVTASTPVLDLSQTWNNAAVSFVGANINVVNTASALTSYPFRVQVGGSDIMYVRRDGYLRLIGSSGIESTGNVVVGASLYLGNTADTILLRDGAANTIALRNSTAAQTFNVYGTYTDASNYRRLRSTMSTGGAVTIAAEGLGTGGSGNVLSFFQDGINLLTFTTATAGFNTRVQVNSGSEYIWNVRSRISSPADGAVLFQNQTQSDADIFLKLGVNTSAAAGIKRAASSTVLQARLNDDSAFATIQGKLRTDNAYVAGAVVGTGYVTITDSTGTAYRVPVLV